MVRNLCGTLAESLQNPLRNARTPGTPQGVFSLSQPQWPKKSLQQHETKHGSTAPIRHRRAQGARPVLGRPSRRPLSVVFEQQTARQQTAHGCADDSSSDARLPLWISQLTRTKANANLVWLDRFEGGVVSACASLRRCAAAPLRRCAAAPLRRCASLASRSPRALAFPTSASVAGVAPRDISPLE